LRTLIATAVAVYLVISIPEILRIPLELFFWIDGYGTRSWVKVEKWYEYFEVFRLPNYWSIGNSYGPFFGSQQVSPWVAALVCLVAAVIPLLAAIWLFRRKAY
jgi:ABC-type transport system involved in multi-copper enzyme maturation permease subunit